MSRFLLIQLYLRRGGAGVGGGGLGRGTIITATIFIVVAYLFGVAEK